MWYFSRPRGRHARKHRRAGSPRVVESLEARTMLSASAAAPAAGSSIPTSTVLTVSPSTIESAQTVALTATVENSVKNIPISIGKVKFVVESPKPFVLKTADLDAKGQAAVVTDDLTKIGPYLVDAKYIPNGKRFAQSVAAPVLVTVNPLSAVSFLVRPDRRYGHLNRALGFTVTAIDAQNRPETNYTGTITFTSPTDSWTTLPKRVYANLAITPPPPQTTGLASFPVKHYTFTPEDHGTHHFLGGVTFGKAGAEILRVAQENNPKVSGKTTFAIF
jgi:Bacterial Ig-like domain (group 3)